MSSVKYPLVGGETARLTRLDSCGRPAYGDRAFVTSDGIVSVAVTANYDDGSEVVITNFRGKRCVNRKAEAELISLSVEVVLCQVDPEMYTVATGFPQIIDPVTGNTTGFRVNRSVRPSDVKWALEVWSDARGAIACDDDQGDLPFGYLLWPFLSGGRVGDFTIEANNAVTFTITGAETNDGSGWGDGPFAVIADALGAPSVLSEPVDPYDHMIIDKTTVAPPLPTDGLVPLDDPDGPDATGAVAGIPGTFTPAGAVRPEDYAALDASSITASPTTAWTVGQHVILGDGSYANWDGNTNGWVPGKAT